MKAKKMPAEFWGEAVTTAVFILNRAPTKALKGKTPFEACMDASGMCPSSGHLVALAMSRTQSPTSASWRTEARPWCCWAMRRAARPIDSDPKGGRVVVSRDVVFDEMAAWD